MYETLQMVSWPFWDRAFDREVIEANFSKIIRYTLGSWLIILTLVYLSGYKPFKMLLDLPIFFIWNGPNDDGNNVMLVT